MSYNASSASATPAPQPPVAWLSVRLFGAVSYTLLSSTSLAMNCLLAVVLFRGRAQFAKNPFFVLVCQLLVADLVEDVVQLGVAVPTTFAGEKIYADSLGLELFMQLDSVTFYATLYFSALITANRLTVFFAPILNARIFSAPAIYLIVGAIWLFTFVQISLYVLSGAVKAFSETGFYMYNVYAVPASQLNLALRQWSYFSGTYLPAAMLAAYLVMFLKVRYFSAGLLKMSAEEKLRKQRERRFLTQAFLICGFLELQGVAFFLVPRIPETGQWNFVVTFALNWSGILVNSLSALILFAYNSEVREEAQRLLYQLGLSTGGGTPVTQLR